MVNLRSRSACVLLFTIAALWTTTAHADWRLGVGLTTGLDTGELAIDPGGPAFGAGGHLGYVIDLPLVDVVPELAVSYVRFPGDEIGNAPQAITSTRFGARLELGIPVLSPAVYGHGGYASLAGEGSDYILERSGWSYDVGAALDLTVIPAMRVGVHATYNAMLPDEKDEVTWTEVGAHVAFEL